MIDITPRDHDILETLTRRVQPLSLDHVCRIWWPNQVTSRNARRRLRQLARRGYVERRIVNVHAPLDVHEPLTVWWPGKSTPDPMAVSQSARNRWHGAAQPTELFSPTRLTANLFGSAAVGLPKLFQLDHDLLLADVYVLYRARWPELARQWLGENALPKGGVGIKDPDAFLIDDCGKAFRAVESAGRFTPRQVAEFHEHCVVYNLSYELW